MRALLVLTALMGCNLDGQAGTYSDAVLADNPVGYWRLGETSGTVATNQTVTSNHGVYQNSPMLGQTGAISNDTDKAVKVAVGTDYVEVGHTASLNLNPNGMTLEAWVTLDTAQPYGTIMMKSTTSTWADGYGFYLEGGNLKLFVNQYNSSPASVAFPTSAAYRHVVGTYDGSFLRIYTNGVLAATQANTLLIDTTANSLRIGKGAGAGVNDYDWVGNIDEVAVYNYALSAADIAEHYTFGALGIPEPSAMALLGLGGLVISRMFRRKRETEIRNEETMTQKAPVPTLMSRLTRIAPLVALSCLVASGLEASEIAHWKFDGDLLDSSGNGYDLSVGAGSPSFSNATPPNITSSSSVYLNGSAQLTHLLATPLSLSSAYSIAAWIKAPQPGPSGGYPGMFSLGKAGVGSDVEVYLQQINNDLVIQHNQGNGGSLDWTGVDYPSSVGGVWLHVALTYDSSLAAAQQYKIYFNGTVQTKTQNAPNIGFPEMTPPVMSSPQTISVGKLNHNAFGPNFFNGLVDEMYVFNHALSVAEIGMLVPEPSVMAFLGLGGLLLWRRHPC